MTVSEPLSLSRLRKLLVTGRNCVTWRHDIDCDLAAAALVAEMEHALDVHATFYVWPRSPFYNLFGPEGRMLVDKLRELGHRIGLHVDLERPRDAYISDDYALDKIEADYALVYEAFGDLSIERVSFHKPPRSILWRDLPGVDSAYASRWFGRYFSDSRGELDREADEAVATRAPLQVLLHPEWWVYAGGDWISARDKRHRRVCDEMNDVAAVWVDKPIPVPQHAAVLAGNSATRGSGW